jgi:SAM-dependent methyltransferase
MKTSLPGMRNFERVRFGRTEDAYDGFSTLLKDVIDNFDCRQILDVGGGAQPQLSEAELAVGSLDYTVMDISEAELAHAPDTYKKVVMDIAGDMVSCVGRYDLVFSRFVAEHVKNANRLHSNVLALLKPGGIAIHFFPTLFALPFLVNKLLPEWLTVRFLSKQRQARGKFAAYYRWCVGPTQCALRRYERLGYEVLEYAGFFGHGYYDGLPILRRIHGIARTFLLRHPVACLTSFAWVVLRKPESWKEGDGSDRGGGKTCDDLHM